MQSIHCLRGFAIAACALIAAGGCRLDRSIIPSWTTLQPQQYCPGDTLTASYDFLREETCPADAGCATHHPTIAITSINTPPAFPARTVSAFRDSFTFVPAGNTVGALFDTDRETVTVPTARFDGSHRIFVQRMQVRDTTLNATRIDGALSLSLTHGGMCTGSGPQWASADIPGPPRFSPNLRVSRVINTSGTMATISVIDTSGAIVSQTVAPGGSFTPDMTGAPPRNWSSVHIAPLSSPILCGSGTTTPFPPVPALTTAVELACR